MSERALPVLDLQAPADAGACCGACASAEAASLAADAASLPVSALAAALPLVVPRHRIDRDADRRVTFGGLGLAGGFLGLAVLGLAHLVVGRTGLWVPLHLAMAGGASTAIAAVMPFFTAALAGAPPLAARWRGLAIGCVAGGALVVSVAVPAGWTGLALAAGSTYVAGIGLVALVAVWPLRAALGVRRPLVEIAYVAALVQVTIGATIALALVAGIPAVAANWAMLKPAHAWLNVFGFLAVVIAASLFHLAPTVAGGRIKPRRSAVTAIAGLLAGPPLVAAGLVLAADPVVRVGAAVELAGAVALVTHAAVVRRDGGMWTTDPGWHRFTGWSLVAAPAWLLAAVAIAAGRLLWLGADPAAWSVALIAAPLALGFVVQVVIGSWTHLVPAIGPGDMAVHARQRVVLGRMAAARVVALNLGVGLAALGAIGGEPLLIGFGLALIVPSVAGALVLLAWSAGMGRRVRP
ncbi:MAG: hypothetical protein WEG56_13410 [Chloroflexota bacterium]